MMPVREIVAFAPPEPVPDVLRTHATEVTAEDTNVQSVVDDLLDTMFASEIAIGLAAPQIGHSVAVAVINLKKANRADSLVLINPEIVSATGKKDRKQETCMSVKGVRGEVERRSKVTVRYLDREGNERSLDASGFLARAIAHEVDHLTGTLYIERMPPGARLEKADIFTIDSSSG